MPTVAPPPFSRLEPVVDVLHGIPVADPYRWLEDQNSPETRAWIEEQTRYARTYLDRIPGRARIRARVRELLDVETYDSFLKCGNRYFFRKRLPGQEQPSLYFREGPEGEDQLLLDPARRGTGDFTAARPLRVSPDGSLLLYEIKQGGERMGTFEILDVASRRTLPDRLPRGYLRGFAFAPDCKSFFYVHEAAESKRPFYRAAYRHVLGQALDADAEIFRAGEDEKLRLAFTAGSHTVGFLVYQFRDKTYTDFYLWSMGSPTAPLLILRDAAHSFAPQLLPERILALVDAGAPNRRIVEVQPRKQGDPLYFDLVPESDARIRSWATTANYILVSYVRGTRTEIMALDRFGSCVATLPCQPDATVRISAVSPTDDVVILEQESFTRPPHAIRCVLPSCEPLPLTETHSPWSSDEFECSVNSFRSKDNRSIPISLFGRDPAVRSDARSVVMTAYGGFGVPSTPRFSVLVAILVEAGCLFALPNIRGGCEFGSEWHEVARRTNRQIAFDDFLCAAEFLIGTHRTSARQLAIFGGSNSGLLVTACMMQRPDLFGVVLCMAPLTDMLRYHLFDGAEVWTDEFGTSTDPHDFPVLFKYSPYHAVRNDVNYPPTLFVAGDADQNCNAMHARKMTARLQAASVSNVQTLLDYRPERGHSAVLPLSVRIDALVDRISFLWDYIGKGEFA
jgi:prolyl oligopeptidase